MKKIESRKFHVCLDLITENIMIGSIAMIKPTENPGSESKKHGFNPGPQSFEAMVRNHLEKLVRGIGKNGEDRMYRMVMETVERCLLDLVLNHSQGNQVEAARILGINRNTLARRLKSLHIQEKARRGRKKLKK